MKWNKCFWLALAAALLSLAAPSRVFAQGPGGGALGAGAPGAGESTPEIDEEEYAKDSTTEINVKNADIAAIVRIFSKKTKRNYILDERVKGKVSIYLPGKVSADESIRILDAVLSYKGFAAVPIGENLWKIVPAKEARQSTIPTQTERPTGQPSQSMVTRLVQLKYISTEDVKQLISPLVSADGLINAYQGTNSLLLIDSEDNIERLVTIINSLDVPSTDREMTIIPIKYADSVDIAGKLNDLLGEGSSKGGGAESGLDLLRARMRDAAGAAASHSNPQAPGNPPAGTAPGSATASAVNLRQPKIIPDERTNSIIVVADEDTTARIRALISQLDSKIDLSGNRFYVYRCQHANAQDLADVLSALTGGGGGSSTTGRRGTGTQHSNQGMDLSSSFGNSRNQSSTSRGSMGSSRYGSSQNRLNNSSRSPGQSLFGNERSATSVAFGDNISITADPATNSLIIVASKTDYEKIKNLLEKLDIKRRQVIVEAILLEVGLDNKSSMGTSFITSGGGKDGAFIAQNNGSNIVSMLQNPAAIQDFSVAAASAGTLSIGDTIKIPTQTVLLNAARANSNVNILSAPTILTTDNEQAEIVVGQNVPFLASTATSDVNLNNTFNSIDRQDVGITLRLTPQISSGDVVTLKIFTEVSTVVATDPKLGPTTAIRTSETSVIAKDSQMIVMGGLISDNINEGDRGVPFLKDVPVLGHFFRSETGEHQRTNLLIMITPRIVKDQFDARDVTIARRDRLEGEIFERDLHPERREVLRDEAIDKVSEGTTFDGQAPTTILAPKQESEPPQDADVIEFKVNPKLPAGPSAGAGDERAALRPPANKARGKETDASPPAPRQEFQAAEPQSMKQSALRQAPDQPIFIVVKLLQGKTHPDNLPFTVSNQDLVALVLPSDSGPQVKEFFRVGQSYGYQLDQSELALSPVGVFGSEKEAESFFPEISSSWYTLSPYELMNLGFGPWFKKG